MTRAGKSTVIRIILVCLILGIIGTGTWFFLQKNDQLEAVYGERIQELQNKISMNTKRVFCASKDLKAGTLLDEDCLISSEIITDRTGFISMNDIGNRLLVDVPQGTEIMKIMVTDSIEDTNLREIEYDWIDISSNIEVYDYIDVRIRYLNGEDYCVLSKKQLKALNDTKLVCDLWNTEEELLLLNSACVDAFLYEGSTIYVTKYIAPMIQEPSIVNYTPTETVISLINEDPNIVEIASEYLMSEIRKRREKSIEEFLMKEGNPERYDKNGLYLGTLTDAELYAEDLINTNKPMPGTEMPNEFGAGLWD